MASSVVLTPSTMKNLLPDIGFTQSDPLNGISLKKESVEPIPFVYQKVVVKPKQKQTMSNTPHPYRYGKQRV